MSVRVLLTDAAWAELAPILAPLPSHAGSPPARSARRGREAVLALARPGPPWRDVPEDVGHWDARGLWRRLCHRSPEPRQPHRRHPIRRADDLTLVASVNPSRFVVLTRVLVAATVPVI